VLLVFAVSLLLAFSLLFFTKRTDRKKWTILIVLVLLVSFIFAYISVSNVWTPATTSFTVRAGERGGHFPWSKLSYPIYMTVEHYFNRYTGRDYSGTVHFNIFLAWTRIITVNGQFYYPAVYGEVRLSYSLDSPFFTASTFYAFIVALFTALNLSGSLLGFALAHILSRRVSRFRRGNGPHRVSS
jgi:hypothetical protein